MSRLSSPLTDLAPHYDVVVIGSGYGGAISASRMARAGRTVCVLERGREIRPGEFPDAGHEIIGEVQVSLPFPGDRAVHLGSETSLFDVHVDDDINVLVGCGLGGTSLINANVSLRPDPRVFDRPEWPSELAADRALIDTSFERAEAMLKPVSLPAPNDPPKTRAHARSANETGSPFFRAPINVNFEDQINHVGVHQPACTHCGDCVSGCNVGAKNTVLMNYLPDAHNHGAEIFCEASVDRVEPDGDGAGWLVRFEPVGAQRDLFDGETLFVRADTVILAAGTLGTVGILLRSREAGLPLSDQLGKRFTGNGDMLGFAYDTDERIQGIGWGAKGKGDEVGPCITSVIDNRGTDELTDGYIIEEGAIPGAISPFFPSLMETAARLAGQRDDEAKAERGFWSRLFGDDDDEDVVHRTQTYLVMAHDDGAGEIYLASGRPRVRWPDVGDQNIFQKVSAALKAASSALQGTYVPNPVWTSLFGKDLVTVHPLGGAAMGENASYGVTDHKGRVYRGVTGDEVHDGLYVSDGALIPRPLGVNPLLTISAFAERNAWYIAADNGWTIDYSLPSAPRTADEDPGVRVRFTESMKGWFSTEETEDYAAAKEQGEEDDSPLQFILTITGNLDEMIERDDHPARMVGTVSAPALSAKPMMVNDGHFNLFVQDPDDELTKRMWYRMRMQSVEGERFYFEGFKEIRDDPGFDLWSDTTTLYITVHEGDDASGPRVGRGILRIKAGDFMKQITTMRILGADSRWDRAKGLARFGKAFAGELWDTFGIG